MCSGHCLQGLLAVGAVIERFILDNESLSDNSWAALEQYAVDIGDRRVMAGVHYPSDNICSWLIAILMADHVYQTRQMRLKLWEAITKRSFVYRAILDWVRTGNGDSYKESLTALESAARGEITLISAENGIGGPS